MSVSPEQTLNAENATLAWDELAERANSFIEAWETTSAAPEIADFLPEKPPVLRRLVLVELVKIDLENRWQRGDAPKLVEDYVRQYPELGEGGLPSDLIYEEYHVRKQAGDPVQSEQYCDRFPDQAVELRRLLGLEAPNLTTMLVDGARPMEVEVGDRVADFDLLTRLGKGAFASVFLARQRSMQRLVALKVSADRGNEPQTMAQLDHPNIVRVYDQRILPERKLRLLYMQFVAGGTLESVIDHVRTKPPAERHGRTLLEGVDKSLDRVGESAPAESSTRDRLRSCTWPEAVCRIGIQLATALDYAHERGVLHRDVKPANILISAEGVPKLADFNISSCSKLEGATPGAYFGGSLAYMSPEHLEACNPGNDRTADELDGRTDVYSLAVVLWELLTGQRPFVDEAITGNWTLALSRMAERRRAGVPADAIARLPADCPQGLREVLEQALSPNRDVRFSRGLHLARQLELCLQPDTQQLLRPSPGDRWRHVRRRPLIGLFVAGLLPNVAMSLLNIYYNKSEIVRFMSLTAQQYFPALLGIINVVAYSLGIALILTVVWPVLLGLRNRRAGVANDPQHLMVARKRCLRSGDYVALVSTVLWALTGLTFPALLHDDSVGLRHYAHFISSCFLSGQIAATMTFFCVTLVMVRVCYPLLLDMDTAGEEELKGVRSLSIRIWVYFCLAVVIPFVALILISTVISPAQLATGGNGSDADGSDRRLNAIPVLASIGLLASIAGLFITQLIRKHLAALAVAVAPPQSAGGLNTSDSFWTGSR